MLNLNLRPLQPGSQQGPDSGRTVSMSCQHPHINTRMRERKFKVTARLAPTDILRAFDGRARPSHLQRQPLVKRELDRIANYEFLKIRMCRIQQEIILRGDESTRNLERD